MTRAALQLSKSYRTSGGLLWEQALASRKAGTWDALRLRRFEIEIYHPLLAHALDVVVRDALDASPRLKPLIAQVQRATKDLEAGLRAARQIEASFSLGLRVVEAAASVVLFVATPSASSAGQAVNAIGQAARLVPTLTKE